MPQRIPMGIAMTAATTKIIRLPSKALAMPPPASPTGLGILIRKCQLILVTPALIIKIRMAIRGNTQAKASVIVNRRKALLFPIRYLILLLCSFICETTDDPFSDHINYNGNKKQDQSH